MYLNTVDILLTVFINYFNHKFQIIIMNNNKEIGCLLVFIMLGIVTFIIPIFLSYNSYKIEQKREKHFYESPIKNVVKVKIKYLAYSHTNKYGLEIAEGILNNKKIYYPMSKINHKNHNFFIITFENNNVYLASIPKQLDPKLVFKTNNSFYELSRLYHLSLI